jgi:hypothetical protein
MGQLESLRELSIAQPAHKKKKEKIYALVIVSFDMKSNKF